MLISLVLCLHVSHKQTALRCFLQISLPSSSTLVILRSIDPQNLTLYFFSSGMKMSRFFRHVLLLILRPRPQHVREI